MALGLQNAPIISTQSLEISRFPNCRYYHFAGGEPFLDSAHKEVLEAIASSAHADEIVLNYNSNLSISRKVIEELLPVWKRFKHVYISPSIDHTDQKKLSYIRNGANHELIFGNLELLRPRTLLY